MNAPARLAVLLKGSLWDGDLFLVGGAVRDELLGRPSKGDWDFVTRGDAPALARHLWEIGAASHFPVVYERFGTAMVHLEGEACEFVTARRESYDAGSRKPSHVKAASYEEDAARRDFTCNALLRSVFDETLVDPLGRGVDDLRAGVLRTPLDPRATFRDDPLRMMRAVRFRHRLGFVYADGLAEAMREEAGRLAVVSVERWTDEFLKILSGSSAGAALGELASLGLLDLHFPEWREMAGVSQGSFHHLDVWDHTRLVVDNVGRGDENLALAALLHDVGKPATRSVEADGKIRFFGHEAVGAEMTLEIGRRWKLPNARTARIAALVKAHMRLGTTPEFSAAAARRLTRDMGDDLETLLRLVEADADGLKPGVRRLDLGPVRARLEEVRASAPAKGAGGPLDGRRIMEITGCAPGPEVGRWKAALLEKVLDGELAGDDPEAAEGWLRVQMGAGG